MMIRDSILMQINLIGIISTTTKNNFKITSMNIESIVGITGTMSNRISLEKVAGRMNKKSSEKVRVFVRIREKTNIMIRGSINKKDTIIESDKVGIT